MLAYLLVWLPTLLYASHNSIRDGIEIGGGGEDRGELGGEEREDNDCE
jgi:hypothetical protein